jgi:hypothetical protein
MRFYKNSELVRRYSVSDKTVRNWIAASLAGKLDLKLLNEDGKHFIADSVANNTALKRLVTKGKKYRNGLAFKVVKPRQEFYELFSLRQIIDIANMLEKDRELSWHYSYFGKVAPYWNEYLTELYNSGEGNLLTNTIDTFKYSYPYLDQILERFDHVNVVNVCIGNNMAAKDIIAHVQATGKLNRCVAIDISDQILEVAKENTRQWYEGVIELETHTMDLRRDWFGDILADNPELTPGSKVVNLVLFVAGPIANFKRPEQVLRNIHDSLGIDDLLFISKKRDTQESRQFFDFNIKNDKSLMGAKDIDIAAVIGIDESCYTFEQGFDPERKMRFMRLRLNVGLAIQFETSGFTKTVEFEKGEIIFLWRYWQMTDKVLMGYLRDTDFSILQSMHSIDRQLITTISKVKDGQDL